MNGAIKITIDGNVIGLKFAYPAIRMFLDTRSDMNAAAEAYFNALTNPQKIKNIK